MILHRSIHTLALFSSASTLVCCALPALFVALGAGATLIGVVSTVPQLIWLSEHKIGLFVFSAIMLTISGISRYATRNAPCPIDHQKAKACARTRRFSTYLLIFSLTLYVIGFFFAFIAPKLL